MKFSLIYLSVLLFAIFVASEKARFDNYRVYEILIENSQQLELLQQIENYPDGYNFWSFPGETGTKAELVVPPHKFGEFSEYVEDFELKTKIMINNLQEVIDKEQPLRRSKAAEWTRYWELPEIHEWLQSLATKYPQSVSLLNIGKSHEGRDLLGVKINIGGGTKKTVILEGTMHAREWISTATSTWIINELLTTSNPEAQEVATMFEWVVFPVANPDGYAYTWSRNRSWRKTRRPSNRLCFGADPNRNWDNNFNQAGSSSNPCSDTFAGSAPFSEPETLHLSNYIKTLPQLVGYFSFHAFGQMMMVPYGWTRSLMPNYQEVIAVAEKGRQALTREFGTEYRIGSISNVIYLASGSSVDWVEAEKKTNVTFAYECRDQGRFGFSLPATQIIDNSIEVFASVVAILKEARLRNMA